MSSFRLERGEVDLVRLRVHRGDAVCSLTAMEARLLAYLAAHRERAVEQAELLREVWGYAPQVKSRTVETTVGRLRAKIELDPARPRHLVTVAGAGYRLVLPDPVPDAVLGRQDVLAAIDRAFASASTVALVGPPGIGKSAVARAWRASHTGGVRVVDPASDADVAAARGARVLLVTSDPADLPAVDVPPLSAAAARELLRRASGLADPEIDALVGPLDGWPRAIEEACRWTSILPASELAARLERDPLALLPGLAADLGRALSRLEPDERATLAQLSAFRGGFDLAAAEQVVRLDGWVGAPLRRLRARGLVRSGARLAVSPLVAALAARDAPPEVYERHGAWAVARGESLVLARRRDPAALLALEAELPNLRAAFERSDADTGARLALAAEPALFARGPWDALIAWLDVAVARGPGPGAAARLHAARARVLVAVGRLDEADAALERAGADPDGWQAAVEVVVARGRGGGARPGDRVRAVAGEAFARAAAAGDDVAAGIAARWLALADRYDAERPRMGELLDESARRLRRAGDRVELSDTLRHRADLLLRAGDLADARRHLEAALGHIEGDTRREGLVLEVLAAVEAEAQHLDRAVEHLEAAAERHRRLGARRRELHLLLRLAEIRLEGGALEAAGSALDTALAAALDVADPRLEAAVRETASRVAFDQGDQARACSQAQASVAAFATLGDRFHLAIAQSTLARARHALGDPGGAVALYRELLPVLAGAPALEVGSTAAAALAAAHAGEAADLERWAAHLAAIAGPDDHRIVAIVAGVRSGRRIAVPPQSRDERVLILLSSLALRDLTGL